jgi:hypothetical protein
MDWIGEHPEGAVVTVWVVPGASRTEIQGIHDGALRVRVAAPAEGGKANRELERVLKRTSGARRATLISGTSARRKTLLLQGIDPEEGRSALGPGDS